MKFFIVLALAVATCVIAAPQGNPNDDVKVTRWLNDQKEDNVYQFVYELSDGQIRGEGGAPRQIGEERPIVVSGAYSFVAPDGQIYWVTYTADENGYHPVVGTGPEGGPKPGQDFGIDPNALKSLIG